MQSKMQGLPARHTVAVGSGKGGVGKSTVSLNIALALAESGTAVGILDADLYGPNIPLMVGLARRAWSTGWTIASKERKRLPQIERYGLKIMSAGFIIAEDQPMGVSGATVRMLLTQLLTSVEWGALDYLIIDLPPGTSDVQQGLVQTIPLSGAVLVVTPQDVAHLDGRKALRQYADAGVPLLGGVENMSGFPCPHCGETSDIFARVSDERSIWALGVDKLGAIPLDPALSRAGDTGQPLLIVDPRSPRADAFRAIARRIEDKLAEKNV